MFTNTVAKKVIQLKALRPKEFDARVADLIFSQPPVHPLQVEYQECREEEQKLKQTRTSRTEMYRIVDLRAKGAAIDKQLNSLPCVLRNYPDPQYNRDVAADYLVKQQVKTWPEFKKNHFWQWLGLVTQLHDKPHLRLAPYGGPRMEWMEFYEPGDYATAALIVLELEKEQNGEAAGNPEAAEGVVTAA